MTEIRHIYRQKLILWKPERHLPVLPFYDTWRYLHANFVYEITFSSFETQQFHYLFPGVAMNSTISSKNDIYMMYSEHLCQFLEPAVGKDARWLLCYCASLHGWSVSTFRSRCDGKMNTVTIIKKDEYVFGGFKDIPWGKIVPTGMKG